NARHGVQVVDGRGAAELARQFHAAAAAWLMIGNRAARVNELICNESSLNSAQRTKERNAAPRAETLSHRRRQKSAPGTAPRTAPWGLMVDRVGRMLAHY